MIGEILEDGVRWSDGAVLRADVILWCTGIRSSLDHLAPLMLRESGGTTMIGKLATQAAKNRHSHLPGALNSPARPPRWRPTCSPTRRRR
jgi:hypothetical protein